LVVSFLVEGFNWMGNGLLEWVNFISAFPSHSMITRRIDIGLDF